MNEVILALTRSDAPASPILLAFLFALMLVSGVAFRKLRALRFSIASEVLGMSAPSRRQSLLGERLSARNRLFQRAADHSEIEAIVRNLFLGQQRRMQAWIASVPLIGLLGTFSGMGIALFGSAGAHDSLQRDFASTVEEQTTQHSAPHVSESGDLFSPSGGIDSFRLNYESQAAELRLELNAKMNKSLGALQNYVGAQRTSMSGMATGVVSSIVGLVLFILLRIGSVSVTSRMSELVSLGVKFQSDYPTNPEHSVEEASIEKLSQSLALLVNELPLASILVSRLAEVIERLGAGSDLLTQLTGYQETSVALNEAGVRLTARVIELLEERAGKGAPTSNANVNTFSLCISQLNESFRTLSSTLTKVVADKDEQAKQVEMLMRSLQKQAALSAALVERATTSMEQSQFLGEAIMTSSESLVSQGTALMATLERFEDAASLYSRHVQEIVTSSKNTEEVMTHALATAVAFVAEARPIISDSVRWLADLEHGVQSMDAAFQGGALRLQLFEEATLRLENSVANALTGLATEMSQLRELRQAVHAEAAGLGDVVFQKTAEQHLATIRLLQNVKSLFSTHQQQAESLLQALRRNRSIPVSLP